jgi:hypothetical protein
MNRIIADINATQTINNTHTKEKNEMKNTNNNKKNMITIRNYTYETATGKTTIYWSDNTQTTVVAEPNTKSSQYVGFVSACAKKLFGNKSTYLNQFDKWTVKKPEQERKKAEAEKTKAEEQAKIEAERAERAKARKIEKLAKKWVNEYRMKNEDIEICREARKLAKEKYYIPEDWFNK